MLNSFRAPTGRAMAASQDISSTARDVSFAMPRCRMWSESKRTAAHNKKAAFSSIKYQSSLQWLRASRIRWIRCNRHTPSKLKGDLRKNAALLLRDAMG